MLEAARQGAKGWGAWSLEHHPRAECWGERKKGAIKDFTSGLD